MSLILPERVQDLLSHFAPLLSFMSMVQVEPKEIMSLYTIKVVRHGGGCDGKGVQKELLLIAGPNVGIKLLRQEQFMLLSGAMLIQFLRKPVERSEGGGIGGLICPNGVRQDGSMSILQNVVPFLIRYSNTTNEIGYSYTILDTKPGILLSTAWEHITPPERRLINRQIGKFVRLLASVTSPTSRFGAVVRVCENPFANLGDETSLHLSESTRWSTAFMDLMESTLRDGEDMAVLLPYEVIRDSCARFSWFLDVVSVPRLLILNAGETSNILISREPSRLACGANEITLVGLRDWSQGVFGDPLLARCFDRADEDFLEGWRKSESDDLIEHEESTLRRLILYRCYRAVVDIVKDYYRPDTQSSSRELEARRRLTTALAELEFQ